MHLQAETSQEYVISIDEYLGSCEKVKKKVTISIFQL